MGGEGSAVQCSTVQYSAVQCSAVQCSTVQCGAVCVVQGSTGQGSIVLCGKCRVGAVPSCSMRVQTRSVSKLVSGIAAPAYVQEETE